jgi:protein-disulfide isomerase
MPTWRRRTEVLPDEEGHRTIGGCAATEAARSLEAGDARLTRRSALLGMHAVPEGTAPAPLEEPVDHVRGPDGARVILEYGDYECPHSRMAFREIERVEQELGGGLRFAFRHCPLSDIHPYALAAAAAAEAAAAQGRFWETHDLLFQRQNELEDDDLRRHGEQLVLDVARFDRDRGGGNVIDGIRRDVESALATGQVQGTPTLFIDGLVWRGQLRREHADRRAWPVTATLVPPGGVVAWPR